MECHRSLDVRKIINVVIILLCTHHIDQLRKRRCLFSLCERVCVCVRAFINIVFISEYLLQYQYKCAISTSFLLFNLLQRLIVRLQEQLRQQNTYTKWRHVFLHCNAISILSIYLQNPFILCPVCTQVHALHVHHNAYIVKNTVI